MFNSSVSTHTTAPYNATKSTPFNSYTSKSLLLLLLLPTRLYSPGKKKKKIQKPTCHRLPDNVTYAQGALLEPLSVVLHAISHTRLHIGRGAVICGAGPIGLVALACARASGAHPIIITDLEPKRLAFAKDFVPSCTPYQIDRSLDAPGNAAQIRALFGATEYEAPGTILECTGVESSVITAAYTVRKAGDLMVIGVGRDTMNNLPFMHISLSEVRFCRPFPLLSPLKC